MNRWFLRLFPHNTLARIAGSQPRLRRDQDPAKRTFGANAVVCRPRIYHPSTALMLRLRSWFDSAHGSTPLTMRCGRQDRRDPALQ